MKLTQLQRITVKAQQKSKQNKKLILKNLQDWKEQK